MRPKASGTTRTITQNRGTIPYNADDPLEVEVAKEMIAARKQMSEDILAMLDKTKTAGAGDEDE
jgi:hypothetical protein